MSQAKLKAAIKRVTVEQSYTSYSGVANLLDQMTSADSELPELKIAILRNFTVEPLLPVIKTGAAQSGFHPMVHVGGYDTIAADVMDPQSGLYAFAPQVIFVVQWLESLAPGLVGRFPSLSSAQVNEEINRVLSMVSGFLEAIRRHTQAPVIVNNFALPLFPAMGILDGQSNGYQYQSLLTLNAQLAKLLGRFANAYLLDLMGLMARIGRERGVDERYWQVGQAPIGRNALIPLGEEYVKFVRALNGRARKCLVLDCDNVLWGGIVGEDGINNIQLGKSYPGSCYQALQKEVLNCHDRGVILALCSKNNQADVMEVLKSHPEMLLREDHLATHQINWDDKVTNLKRIARDLNIGLDSMVFVDDNMFECDMVREQLPQVAVLCLSGDPSSFSFKLQEKGYFDTLSLSNEDRRRNQMYRENAKREGLLASSHGSMEDYLASLEMKAYIGLADDLTAARISQLTQKTNQFNLTTRRYTDGDIHALMADPAFDVWHLRLTDRISDMGLVGVVIVKYSETQAEIDTFLLSCRVLGRGVEHALMAHVVAAAKEKGCTQVLGRYLATAKNAQVADFYARGGFKPVAQGSQGTDFSLVLQQEIPQAPRWIKLTIDNKRESRHAV